MRGVIHISPGTASLNADRTGHGIDAHTLQTREIDDQTIIAHAQTTGIVATTTHGNEHVVIATEMDRGDDVGDVSAPHDQARMPVNHAIIDLASRLVASIAGLQELPAQTCLEGFQCGLSRHGVLLPSVGAATLRYRGCSPPGSLLWTVWSVR